MGVASPVSYISAVAVPYGNRGCSGGSRMASIMYMVDHKGVDRSSAYPYIGRVREGYVFIKEVPQCLWLYTCGNSVAGLAHVNWFLFFPLAIPVSFQ